MLERVDLCLRVLKSVSEVPLTEGERQVVRKIALSYLHAELGLSPGE